MRDLPVLIPSMPLPAQQIQLRKAMGFNEQPLAAAVGLHVHQIKRYEAGSAQPTLDALVFSEEARAPDEEPRLQFEAVSGFDADEKRTVRELLESMIVKHEARRGWRVPHSSKETADAR